MIEGGCGRGEPNAPEKAGRGKKKTLQRTSLSLPMNSVLFYFKKAKK